MKDKNPRQTVMIDEGTKNGDPRQQEHQEPEGAQNRVMDPVPASLPRIERRFRQTDLPAHFIERRRDPRLSTEQPPMPAPPRFADYEPITGKSELEGIRFLARNIPGKTTKMVNSTAVG